MIYYWRCEICDCGVNDWYLWQGIFLCKLCFHDVTGDWPSPRSR